MSIVDDRTWFRHWENTKVVWLPDVADVNVPQLGELLSPDAVSLECGLVGTGGLSTPRATGAAEFTPWWGNHVRQYPDRWTPTISLTGWVPTQDVSECVVHGRDCCEFGRLWDLSCEFRGAGALVIRRGMPHDLPFRAGQFVTLARGRWGARSITDLADAAAMFTVPFLVEEETGFRPNTDVCTGEAEVVPGTVPLPCGLSLCTEDGVVLSSGGDTRTYGDHLYGDFTYGGEQNDDPSPSECDGDPLCNC